MFLFLLFFLMPQKKKKKKNGISCGVVGIVAASTAEWVIECGYRGICNESAVCIRHVCAFARRHSQDGGWRASLPLVPGGPLAQVERGWPSPLSLSLS